MDEFAESKLLEYGQGKHVLLWLVMLPFRTKPRALPFAAIQPAVRIESPHITGIILKLFPSLRESALEMGLVE